MITATQELILGIIAAQLFQKPMPSLAGADWEQLMKEAEEQAVYKIVCTAVEPYMPEDLKKKYQGKFFAYAGKGMRNFYHHGRLDALLKANGVPYVFIKGVASAAYYPEPLLRTMGDVDFLVREADIPRVTDLLIAEGYETNGKESGSHTAFHKEGETFELHREPGGLPEGEKGDLCRAYLGDMIETEEEYACQDTSVFIPDAFHHGLVMLLHVASHMINSGIGLRHLCDWAVFVDRLGDEEFCALFCEKLQAAGLWRFASVLTGLSVKYLGCPPKKLAAAGVEEDLLDSLIADVFAAGNFGKKDSERINEAKLFTTEGTGTVNGSKGVLIKAVTEKAYKIMPVCKKCRILLPVGWLCVSVRHFTLILRGKRPKIHVGKMITNAEARSKIYSQFRLFK